MKMKIPLKGQILEKIRFLWPKEQLKKNINKLVMSVNVSFLVKIIQLYYGFQKVTPLLTSWSQQTNRLSVEQILRQCQSNDDPTFPKHPRHVVILEDEIQFIPSDNK